MLFRSLIDATGKKVDSYSYTACTLGSTFAKMNGTWKETSTMTRGYANPAETDTTLPSASGTLEGDGGGESSFILGASTSEPTSIPNPDASPEPSPLASPTSSGSEYAVLAVSFIAFGVCVLAGIGGYLAWGPWIKPTFQHWKARYGKNS